jgi:hypothetical protein
MSTAPYVVRVVDPTPTRLGGAPTQTVMVGTPIVPIEYTSSVGLQVTSSGGALPTGLQATLSDGGKRYIITGTPVTHGTYTYTYTLKANDAPDCPGQAISGTITVNGPYRNSTNVYSSTVTGYQWLDYVSWQGCPNTSLNSTPNFTSSTSLTPTCYHDVATGITYYNQAFLGVAANLTYICPTGYALPTSAAATSAAKTPSAALKTGYYNGAELKDGGTYGYSWSTTCTTTNCTVFRFGSSAQPNQSYPKYYGIPVSCYGARPTGPS